MKIEPSKLAEKPDQKVLAHLLDLQRKTFTELHHLLAFEESEAIRAEEERLMRSLYAINADIEELNNLMD